MLSLGVHSSCSMSIFIHISIFVKLVKRRVSWGQFAHEIEKSQGSVDFDIEFAMYFEIHARAPRGRFR